MKSTDNTPSIRTRAIATTGALAIACAAGCITLPFIVPVLAWLGISSLGALATGWYLAMVGVFAAGVGGWLLLRRHRGRSAASKPENHACTCGPRDGADRSPSCRI